MIQTTRWLCFWNDTNTYFRDMGHSIHLQLTLSSTSAEWSKVSRLGRKVACQTAKRRGKTLAALSRDWLRARSTHSVILQKTTQRIHACMPQGILNAFSAHRRILVLLEALIFSAENCTQCMGSWARLKGPILMPLACIVAHFFLSEDTAFLMRVSRKLCSPWGFRRFMVHKSALTNFFW